MPLPPPTWVLVLPNISAPAVEAAFDDDFDHAIASSLEDVSPFEDDLPVNDELSASFEQDLRLDDDATDEQNTAADVSAPAAEPAFDDEFDNAVASSLEDELMLDEHEPIEAAVEAPAAPARAVSDESDEDFADHDTMADVVMDDVDMDFDIRTAEPVEIDEPGIDEPEAIAAKDDEPSIATPEHAFDDDFELSFDDALAEEAEEPATQAPGVAAQPTARQPPSLRSGASKTN